MNPLEFICRSPAFNKQLEEMRPRLYKVAFSWCHTADIADDLAQETVIKAIRNANSLRDMNKMNSWLFTILANAGVIICGNKSRLRILMNVFLRMMTHRN